MIGSQPERVTGTLCNANVPKGSVNYPCTRLQGHQQVPPKDPEPCFAVEVPASVNAHADWRRRQAANGRPKPDPVATSKCPSCGGRLAVVRDDDGDAVACQGCGTRLGRIANRSAGRSVAEQLSAATAASGGLHPRERPADVPDAPARPERPAEQAEAASGDPGAGAGLRQRPGDQPLPRPSGMPIAHEQVIADLRARLELGISRYGQPLRPFNGRSFVQDAYEETLDQAVYLRGLRDEMEASREDLIRELTAALGSLFHGKTEDLHLIGEFAVDFLLGALTRAEA